MTTSSESLIRIEYKLDLIIRALQESNLMIKSPLPDLNGIEEDTCPVCTEPNKLKINVTTETIIKTCSCSLPISITPGISNLLLGENDNDNTKQKLTPTSNSDSRREDSTSSDS